MTQEERNYLKKSLASLKKEYKYCKRYWEMNIESVNRFLFGSDETTGAEWMKEWKHVNRVIKANDYPIMNIALGRDYGGQIKELEARLKQD